jgi:hypothetical protein
MGRAVAGGKISSVKPGVQISQGQSIHQYSRRRFHETQIDGIDRAATGACLNGGGGQGMRRAPDALIDRCCMASSGEDLRVYVHASREIFVWAANRREKDWATKHELDCFSQFHSSSTGAVGRFLGFQLFG